MQTKNSEVAYLRQQIEAEYTAGQQALSGLAYGISQHQFITQRLENMERCRKELVGLVGQEEASKIFVETLDRVQQKSDGSR
jgi:hypothetical protein